MLDGLVSAAVAAQRLGVAREVVVRRIARGELLGLNLGGRWFVREASLPREVEQIRHEPPTVASRA